MIETRIMKYKQSKGKIFTDTHLKSNIINPTVLLIFVFIIIYLFIRYIFCTKSIEYNLTFDNSETIYKSKLTINKSINTKCNWWDIVNFLIPLTHFNKLGGKSGYLLDVAPSQIN